MKKQPSKRKLVSVKELDPLKLWGTKKAIRSDMAHVIGWGSFDDVNKKMVQEHYGLISFNLDLLDGARKFFESIHHDSNLVRCYIPRSQVGPVIFVCDTAVLNSKKEKPTFYAIAPRLEDEVKDEEEEF